MTEPKEQPVTLLLTAAVRGDQAAQEELWSLIYGELHRLAQRQLAGEQSFRAPQTTSLVHEAYLRLFADQNVDWANRRHFFGAAAQAMRRIRIDDARRRKRLKRGGDQRRIPLEDSLAVFDQDPAEVLAVAEALTGLETEDPRKAEVVTLRYFAGMTEEETAAVLGLSRRTVQLEWRFAKAWLHRELSKGDSTTS